MACTDHCRQRTVCYDTCHLNRCERRIQKVTAERLSFTLTVSRQLSCKAAPLMGCRSSIFRNPGTAFDMHQLKYSVGRTFAQRPVSGAIAEHAPAAWGSCTGRAVCLPVDALNSTHAPRADKSDLDAKGASAPACVPVRSADSGRLSYLKIHENSHLPGAVHNNCRQGDGFPTPLRRKLIALMMTGETSANRCTDLDQRRR